MGWRRGVCCLRGRKQFLAVGRAHGVFYVRLISTLKERRRLREVQASSPNVVGWWPKSVTWARFGQGITRVRDLDSPPTH